MPDYIYLLENRLSPSQQSALKLIREAALDAQMTVFLTGGAVRDLTSGSPVRDLDVSVQGNALKLQKAIQNSGAILWGDDAASQTLFFRFPGGVRVEVSSTRRVEYPKPGRPVYHWDVILDDLHRRDFTANAMALSLNEGSYGLLMDPLNGVADIEARQLRLVSNYGFLDEPARLIRATRLAARLGWAMEDKTRARFDNAMIENVVEHLSPWQAAYELEEIGHEEDALKILKAMEAADWMKHLFPAWTSAKADLAELERLREVLIQLQVQGVNPDISAASMELLTARMAPKEIAAMKAIFVRPGFVEEWNNLDAAAKEFAKVLTSRQASTPSAIWKLFTSWNPDAVLWLGLTGKGAAIQEKYRNFFSVWPEARQKIPYTMMQEMRITPELPGYQDLLQSLFYELVDGKLQTEEELKAFLEPFSPPAPPPPVTLRRARTPKKSAEGRGKGKLKDLELDESEGGDADEEEVEPLDAELPSEEEPADKDDGKDDDRDDEEDELEDEAPMRPAARTAGKTPGKSGGKSVGKPGESSEHERSAASAKEPALLHAEVAVGTPKALPHHIGPEEIRKHETASREAQKQAQREAQREPRQPKVLGKVSGSASEATENRQPVRIAPPVKVLTTSVAPPKAMVSNHSKPQTKKAALKPSVAGASAARHALAAKPAKEKAASRPATAKPVTTKPTSAKPASAKPASAKPTSLAKKAAAKKSTRSTRPATEKTSAAKKSMSKFVSKSVSKSTSSSGSKKHAAVAPSRKMLTKPAKPVAAKPATKKAPLKNKPLAKRKK